MAILILVGKDEEALRSGRGERAFTTTETMAILKLRERAFAELMSRGEISPYEEKLGNFQLFKESEVEALRQRRLKRF